MLKKSDRWKKISEIEVTEDLFKISSWEKEKISVKERAWYNGSDSEEWTYSLEIHLKQQHAIEVDP